MKQMDYAWHLRTKMAEKGMFSTTDLQPQLADRGVTLSREQTYRLVAGQPQRLSMHTLVALCDILECTPNDLIEPKITEVAARRAAGQSNNTVTAMSSARRTTIRRPGEQR
ncbi:helix-turn-helix domain-containing protein [Mycobacterium palustre]|uniref:Cro/Cl family transcriptional regulator n=1 Tax=Mycobacterium palustre TaxID=153971 RepID=A0A1X1ZUW0_9MYCO|nr:helix-turn-helix transcriptional regulator [Mycobacterium palustre]MCV7101749.1 helix-turn-helix transcriptional regulator [Mycobacterium palustre]ORW27792.1 Cro/Cl family transcriptional regulator [Mycobacterium palustre]